MLAALSAVQSKSVLHLLENVTESLLACCRRHRDYNNGYNNGYNNNYGRKLKQGGFVANIVCDALGNCDDGRGRRYYDEGRDDRR